MKRLHVHVGVKQLEEGVKFYSALFGAEPVKRKADYAKWMLDDPRVNFAISTRAGKQGVDHLGIQVDEASELREIRDRLKAAELTTFAEGETTCCYARSDKSWVQDPAGNPWEAYQTMEDAEVYSPADAAAGASASACCAPESTAHTGTEQSSGARCGTSSSPSFGAPSSSATMLTTIQPAGAKAATTKSSCC